MRSKVKKILAIFIVMNIIVSSSSLSVLANNGKREFISFETYAQIMTEEYAKNGIEIEVIRPDEDKKITLAMLEEDLQKVDEICSDIKASEEIVYEISPLNETLTLPQRRSMYGTVTKSQQVTVRDGSPIVPRSFTAEVTATIYGDINNGTILEGYAPSLRMVRATGYADYIVRKGYSTYIDNSSSTMTNHSITYEITCEVKEEISIGGTTSWAKVQKHLITKIKPWQ